MEPFRAFVADSLPEEQRTTGFAMQVFFIGAGAVFASALPWMLTHWFGVSGRRRAGGCCRRRCMWRSTSAAVSLLAAVLWTVFTTHEVPPESIAAEARAWRAPTPESSARLLRSGILWVAGALIGSAAAAAAHLQRDIYVLAAGAAAFGSAQLAASWLRRRGRASIGVLEVVEDILHMPDVLRRLAVVQFFTWFGLFAMWIYMTPAVTARHYKTLDAASAAYNRGADWVGGAVRGATTASPRWSRCCCRSSPRAPAGRRATRCASRSARSASSASS